MSSFDNESISSTYTDRGMTTDGRVQPGKPWRFFRTLTSGTQIPFRTGHDCFATNET